MKRTLFTLLATTILTLSAAAHPYNHAIGLRGGPSWGDITYKRYTDANNALDFSGSVSFNGGNLQVNGLYEFNRGLANGINLYYGPGAHVGFYSESLSLGIIGVVGMEYKFDAPIALSLDWRPGLNYFNDTIHFGWNNVGIGIKFCF